MLVKMLNGGRVGRAGRWRGIARYSPRNKLPEMTPTQSNQNEYGICPREIDPEGSVGDTRGGMPLIPGDKVPMMIPSVVDTRGRVDDTVILGLKERYAQIQISRKSSMRDIELAPRDIDDTGPKKAKNGDTRPKSKRPNGFALVYPRLEGEKKVTFEYLAVLTEVYIFARKFLLYDLQPFIFWRLSQLELEGRKIKKRCSSIVKCGLKRTRRMVLKQAQLSIGFTVVSVRRTTPLERWVKLR